jgi:hypothetical protein
MPHETPNGHACPLLLLLLLLLLPLLTHLLPPCRPDKGDILFRKDGKYARIYLKLISLEASGSPVVRLVGNTYISAEQGERLIVREDALTNATLAGNATIADLIKKELKELRVSGVTS